MTLPFGAIRPLPTPNVQSGYVDTSNPGGDAMHRGIRSLIQVLQFNQQQQFEQQKQDSEIQQRLQQQATGQMTGEVLGKLLPALARPSVAGGTVAPAAGMIAPVTVQPDTVSTKLNTAFANKPGTVIQKAASIGGNAISQAISREQATNQAKLTAAKIANRNTELKISGIDGTGILVDKNTGKAQLILDDNGKPVIFSDPSKPTTSGQPRPLGKYTKNGREYIAWSKPGTTRISLEAMPEGFTPSGVPTQSQQQAASRYLSSSTAFRQAKGDPGIPKDALDYIASQVKINSASPMAQWVTTAALSDDVKQSLLNWTTILQNTVYKNSGAAVTVSEFNRAFQRIPIQGEPKRMRDQKLQLTRMDIYSDYLTGRNELGRSTMLNPEVAIPTFQEMWDEPGDSSLSPEDRAKAESDPDFAAFLREKGLWP